MSKVSKGKPKTKSRQYRAKRGSIELANLTWLASIYGNADYIDCKDYKIAFSGKREIVIVSLSSLSVLFLFQAIHF